tara:strand:+ start:5145 stop:7772 length:2628 start_codon:yes stop_codon:yes gene_type:complete
VIKAEIQIHGYRKGHQLLASSVILGKEDQAVMDRLSDAAGPLRPKEKFAPYLSAYPLPSGTYYVIARTWQDLSVPRAGCVRTKSVLLDAEGWASNPTIKPVLRLLDSIDLPSIDAVNSVELNEHVEEQFVPVPKFSASEMLEALFLEDVKPVVVFDAPDPELIALRLLVALWPDIRRRFALSTFALSPRKIGGRDLDLVFAPSNAKARFSDWPGRRVDGRTSQSNRHKWTGAIVRRVFEEPEPRLLSDRDIELLGGQGTDTAAALRVALMWEELLGKLEETPAAALGLLDIANSGMVNNALAVRSLEPRLAEATLGAINKLPPKDAWDFVGAITRKMQGHNMPTTKMAVEQLAINLAERAPDGAFSLLGQLDPKGAVEGLVSSIAIGLGNGPMQRVEQLFLEAPNDLIAKLVSQGGTLISRLSQDERLIGRMGDMLTEVDQAIAEKAGMKLLPFLFEDWQLPAAKPIFGKLDSLGVTAELIRLGNSNDFQAEQLCAALVDRAREVRALSEMRDVLVLSKASPQRDRLLLQTVEPVKADVLWLLDEQRLHETTVRSLLMDVLRRANDKQFGALFSDPITAKRLLTRASDDVVDILARALMYDGLPMNLYVGLAMSVLPKLNNARRFEVAGRVMERCLRNRFDGDEFAILSTLLGILGARLDGRWAVRMGLERGIDAEIASRNLVALENAPSSARMRIVGVVDVIARTLQGRHSLDLSEPAFISCARLMFDAENTSGKALLDAAGLLIPFLLRARRKQVSLMIAALFPMIYREMAKAENVPDLLKFIPFYDWDPCRTARREIVDAFLSSSWNPGDLALTGLRCGDVSKFLKEVVKSHRGEKYIARIENDLVRLDEDDRRLVKRTINTILSNKSHKFD